MPLTDPEAWARHVGEHALAWFALGLLVWLLLLGALGWALQCHGPWRPASATDQPPRPLWSLLLPWLLGFGIVVLAAEFVAELAEHQAGDQWVGRADQALTEALASHVSPATLRVFSLLTHLGDPIWLTALAAAVALWLWRQQRRWLALAWLLSMAGNGLLVRVLKSVFERVRPLHEHGLVQASGWSFPSGHSAGAMLAYGLLAYLMLRWIPRQWHLPAALLAAALAYVVGWSRVFLQVHFASDVAAGLACGMAWLVVSIVGIELSRRWRRRGALA